MNASQLFPDMLNSFRAILDSSPIWEEIRDQEGELIFVSSACERMSGYSGDEFIRNPNLFFDLVHAEDKPLWKKYHQEQHPNPEASRVSFRLLHRNGELSWIEHQCHGAILVGESMMQRCSNQDMTEMKLLQEKKNQLETIVQTLKLFPEVSIVIYDLNGKITFANQYFASLFGKKEDQLVGMNIWKLFPPELAEFRRAVLKQALDRGEMIKVEDHGVTGIYESIVFPLRNEHGVITRVAVISRNITEYKQAQEGLIRDQAELERRVQERTKQIRETNRRLRAEIAERTLVEEQLRAQIERAQVLAQGAERLNQSLELSDVFQTLCEEAVRTIPAMRLSSVLSYDEALDAFVAAATHPKLSIEKLNEIEPLPRSRYDRLRSANGNMLFIPDVSKELQLYEVFRLHGEIKSLLSLPMNYKGETIGILNMCSQDESYQPTLEELSMLFALVQLASSAIANAQLYKEASTQYERLKMLSQKLMHLQEQERAHLARELHDEIGQALTSLNLKINLLMEKLTDEERTSSKFKSEIKQIYQTSRNLLDQVRELSLDLRPALLEDFGLIPALLHLFERTRERLSLEIDFKHSGILEKRFPPQIEISVYRIIQEALTNIARHAGVNEAKVRLWTDADQINLQIEDHGKGFNKEEALSIASASTGLIGMQERVKFCHGVLSIETQLGVGTCISVELPLKEA